MSAIQERLQTARAWWAGLAPRERTMFAAMVAVVGIAALWSLADWSIAERKRLAKALPIAQARLAAMRDDAAEVQRLQRQQARPAETAAGLAEPMQASARGRGLTMDVRVDGGGLHATGSGSFDVLIDWLAEAQRDHGFRATRLSATRGPSGVAFEADLTPPGAQ
ncbi:hypothetical protein GCM10025771_24210 [Niveibacterium umoris]|uniref:General secretion pathway protein M n=1 Tax=Niveibacterium umoris TaxID=1193620 RepID=A0A840BL81_9RHOO|nr:type II secretion system protein GspM [Niveibacterium umoris]MBB4012392.1 general secretion pathway protein M [Niveibacterium umoris]